MEQPTQVLKAWDTLTVSDSQSRLLGGSRYEGDGFVRASGNIKRSEWPRAAGEKMSKKLRTWFIARCKAKMDHANLAESLKQAYPPGEDAEEDEILTLEKFISKLDDSDLRAITEDKKKDVAFFQQIKTIGENKLDYLTSLDPAQVQKLKDHLAKKFETIRRKNTCT